MGIYGAKSGYWTFLRMEKAQLQAFVLETPAIIQDVLSEDIMYCTNLNRSLGSQFLGAKCSFSPIN